MAFFSVKNFLSLVQKRFLSTSNGLSSSPLPRSSSIAAEYLINSCGLSSKSALSISQKLKLDDNNLQKVKSVVEFLKSKGFDDTHIVKMVGKCPRVLLSKVEKTLKPKMDLFVRNGFTGTHIIDLFTSNPTMLFSSLCDEIEPPLEYLKDTLENSDDVIKAMKRYVRAYGGFNKETLTSNVDFLIKQGFPSGNVSTIVYLNPNVLMKKHDELVSCFKAVKDLGIRADELAFMRALLMMLQMNESTLLRKIDLFKSLGWTQDDIVSMIKRMPICMCCSEGNIRNTMAYYVNTLKVEPGYLIANPKLLVFSLDRMAKRYKILKVLESKQLLKWSNQVAWTIAKTDKYFFEKYVVKYEKSIPGLREMYTGSVEAEEQELRYYEVLGIIMCTFRQMPVSFISFRCDNQEHSGLFSEHC
ncbi:uncharacterized protein [Rutidosis leptorrhynchoides]|uniref:uncharacterized protein n=1 Tax=Rutidosis leptorrhynchoides TaxID=125765 RepID=UPI003A993CA8